MSQPIDIFTKAATAITTKTISFYNRLPSGVTPSSSTASAIDLLDSSDSTSTILASSTGSVSGSSVSYSIQGGTDGHDYMIFISTTLSDGQRALDEIIVHVRSRQL